MRRSRSSSMLAGLQILGAVVFLSCTSGSGESGVSAATSTTPASVSPRVAYLTEVLDAVQANAYYAVRIDFTGWRALVVRRAAGPPLSFTDTWTLVGRVLYDLHDNHSTFLTADEYKQLNVAFEAGALTASPPTGEMLPDHLGYLALPSVVAGPGSGAYDAYVNAAHDLMRSPACGWILDLRADRGGSVPPMLAAVAPLLGPGIFVGYEDRRGSITGFKTSDSTVAVVDDAELDRLSAHTGAERTELNSSPVAIITSTETQSAGEAVVMAFLGRDLTRSFGASTRGVPTGNSVTELSDGSALNLTTAIGVDRVGTTHDGPITPDVPIATSSATSADDEVIEQASVWLASQAACAADAP